MENSEKIYKEIEKLFVVDNGLVDILAVSGLDPETTYTEAYLDMLKDIGFLQTALHALLDNFNSVINDLEFEVSEVKPFNPHNMESVAKAAGL